MSYPINYPTPQGANIQIFKEAGSTVDWIKPQGASFVWFTLIGGGSGGNTTTTGGGSGAVTNFMGPAFLIPDELKINVAAGSSTSATAADTTVVFQQKDATGYTLLSAAGGTSAQAGGAASTSNYFSAIGFFQSIAGQSGSTTSPVASTTTFLSGGGAGTSSTSNYGYTASGSNVKGFFQMQPIIVGFASNSGDGAIGCGGGISGKGGNGMVVIITW